MDQKINSIKCTIKLFQSWKRSVTSIYRPKREEYCTTAKTKYECQVEEEAKNTTAESLMYSGNVKGNVESTTAVSENECGGDRRFNGLNIQMLSRSLHQQIFGDSEPSEHLLQKSIRNLMKFGLWSEEVPTMPDVSMKLPKLKGKDIEEHFWSIGMEQSAPYKELMLRLIETGIPERPENWVFAKGWTKYEKGRSPVSVLFPDDDALVFDVEVLVKFGHEPVIAVAVSSNSWYGWVSPSITDGIGSIRVNTGTDLLIPLEGDRRCSERCRIVVGHSVSYDRARVKEQYYMESSGLRFMDTMSLHISVGGASSVQRLSLKQKEENEKDVNQSSCLTSLKDVYQLYCQRELEKAERKIFIDGTPEEVVENFQQLMTYCSNDVRATYEVFQVLFPTFLKRFPHPVTLAGMLEMGMAYLTVNRNWEKYLRTSAEVYDDVENDIKVLLRKKCNDTCRLLHNEEYKKDPWMWDEDWSTVNMKLTKKPVQVTEESEAESEDPEFNELQKRFKYLFDLGSVLPKILPLLPGYPRWYRELCEPPVSPDWKPGPQKLSYGLTISPKILKITYENYPLHHIREFGWGILVADLKAKRKQTNVPVDKLREITLKNAGISERGLEGKEIAGNETNIPYYNGGAIWCNHKIDDSCFFLKLPHKGGNSKNVGRPFGKSLNSIESDLLGGTDTSAQKGIMASRALGYWRNSRDRITGQMVVWLKPQEMRRGEEMRSEVGIIIPTVIVCGTLTRRAVESTWLTASNSREDRLGSELRSMIQAPPGYHFVGADVDVQEMWIASVIGDSRSTMIHGGTPLGWMTIIGDKKNGTDLHSVTAKMSGISRPHAKVINYSRIYGASEMFAARLLLQFNRSMDVNEAKEKASRMYSLTKGIKCFRVKKELAMKLGFAKQRFTTVHQASQFAKKYNMAMKDVFDDPKWEGGMESDVFNELEKIANAMEPKTPFLESRLTRALEPRFKNDNDHLKTRINWVVQSGAVDFLHLMLVCMRWLTNGKIRYAFSFHDEVRYLVPSELRYQAALAMHVSNLLTKSFISHRLGLRDLPLSVAFFSSVEVDKTLRKDAYDECVTLSNPCGLENGYGIPKGESLNIHEVLSKTGGEISGFDDRYILY